MKILVSKIFPNPRQPRTVFSQPEIDELAETMGDPRVGLVQPIVVEPGEGDTFILVDGERRLRAARQLGWAEIEAHLSEGSNHNGVGRLICAFVANVQRADMGAMDKARAYRAMLDELGSVVEVQRVTGKSQTHVYSYLALLEFEPTVQAFFERGALSPTPNVVAALKRLDPESREEIVTRLAVRGVSEHVFLSICKQWYIKPIALRKKKVVEDADASRKVVSGNFNALHLVQQELSVENQAAARATCEDCELYDMASAATCRSCPLVSFLRRV